MVLNKDVLRRIFQFVIAPGDLVSMSTLVSLDNTCTQFREVLNSHNWTIDSLKITKNDVEKFPLSPVPDRKLETIYQLDLLAQHNFLDWRKVNLNIDDFWEIEQHVVLSYLSKKLRGKEILLLVFSNGFFLSHCDNDKLWFCY